MKFDTSFKGRLELHVRGIFMKKEKFSVFLTEKCAKLCLSRHQECEYAEALRILH